MLGICGNCGNYDWDKDVKEEQISCPKCGHVWSYKRLPLYILTGCSGVGKTTTAKVIMEKCKDMVVLDADIFYNIMPSETQEDNYAQIEQLQSLSKNIMQCGKPVLWTMAGNLDKLWNTYNCRFFSDIHCLALVCDEEGLRKRMREGRGITDEGWIQGSVDYNNYFKTHSELSGTRFETLDITGRCVEEVAERVMAWMKNVE